MLAVKHGQHDRPDGSLELIDVYGAAVVNIKLSHHINDLIF